jgi:hypothetical protein
MGRSGQERSEQLIDQLSQQINRWRLNLPAALFLQVTRPLSFVASQALLLCQPSLSFFDDTPWIANYAELLSERANIDRLVARLEEDSRSQGTCGEETD